MKKLNCFLTTAITATFFLQACMTPQGRPNNTASGALAGGATGAMIGGMMDHSAAGAVAGGAVGTVIGGLIGHGMDQEQEARLQAQAPQTMQRVEQNQPLTVWDVESLSNAGISDDLIISQIRNSRTVYHLTTADIIGLKNAGVSERVIDFMINTPSQIPSAEVGGVVGTTPPPPPPEPVIVAPGPDYFWIPGAWIWFGGSWVWNQGYWHRPMHPYPHPRHYHR